MRLSDLHRRVLAQEKFRFLLDDYPNAAAAFSLRKLRSAYTGNCIEVRRSSDNALQNIGFVNNVLDTDSLLSFVGAGDGFVRTWFDQSGNGLNYSNTNVNTTQPRIVNSGVLETDLGKPIIRFISANSTRLTRAGGFLQMHNHSFFNIAKASLPISTLKYFFSFRNSGTGVGTSNRIYNNYTDNSISYYIGNTTVIISTSSFISNTVLMSGNSSSGQQNFYVDGNFIASANNNETATPARTAIGSFVDSLGTTFTSFGDFFQHELIFYPNGQIANRTGIEQNINRFYKIF
jgi:hypothetical protein